MWAAVSMRLTAGAKVDSYEILGALGAGGMGEVYRARDSVLRREVLLYRPMFRMRTGGDPAESSILFSFEIDFAGG